MAISNETQNESRNSSRSSHHVLNHYEVAVPEGIGILLHAAGGAVGAVGEPLDEPLPQLAIQGSRTHANNRRFARRVLRVNGGINCVSYAAGGQDEVSAIPNVELQRLR